MAQENPQVWSGPIVGWTSVELDEARRMYYQGRYIDWKGHEPPDYADMLQDVMFKIVAGQNTYHSDMLQITFPNETKEDYKYAESLGWRLKQLQKNALGGGHADVVRHIYQASLEQIFGDTRAKQLMRMADFYENLKEQETSVWNHKIIEDIRRKNI